MLFFDGKYHGHFDEALVELVDGTLEPEEAGLPHDVTARTCSAVQRPRALERALASRKVAVVITEPALTNNVGLLCPTTASTRAASASRRETGTLLAYDETHTQVVGPGGLTARWGLTPDLVTVGKSIASGIPLGACGMTEDVAACSSGLRAATTQADLVAIGGTLFGNPLSMAAARATMAEVLTDEAYAHTQILGTRLADGLSGRRRAGLPWNVHAVLAPQRTTFRPSHAPTRGGRRLVRRSPAPADPRLPRQPGSVGGHRRRRSDVLGACHDDDVDPYLDGWGSLLDALAR